jgi:hypothetical protein
MEGKPHRLLESVAEDIAGVIFQEYELVSGVKIVIKKPHVAVPGAVNYLGKALYLLNMQANLQDLCLCAHVLCAQIVLLRDSCRIQAWRLRGFGQILMKSPDQVS